MIERLRELASTGDQEAILALIREMVRQGNVITQGLTQPQIQIAADASRNPSNVMDWLYQYLWDNYDQLAFESGNPLYKSPVPFSALINDTPSTWAAFGIRVVSPIVGPWVYGFNSYHTNGPYRLDRALSLEWRPKKRTGWRNVELDGEDIEELLRTHPTFSIPMPELPIDQAELLYARLMETSIPDVQIEPTVLGEVMADKMGGLPARGLSIARGEFHESPHDPLPIDWLFEKTVADLTRALAISNIESVVEGDYDEADTQAIERMVDSVQEGFALWNLAEGRMPPVVAAIQAIWGPLWAEDIAFPTPEEQERAFFVTLAVNSFLAPKAWVRPRPRVELLERTTIIKRISELHDEINVLRRRLFEISEGEQ